MRSSSSAQTIIGTGIAVEQQPERGLALLQLGDVDAQADDAAVLGQPFLDQDDAAVGQHLLMALAGLIQLLDPLGDPFFLAADRFRIIAARDADADRVLEPRARLEQVRAAAVDLGTEVLTLCFFVGLAGTFG